ncbi:hypothetical protein KL928_004810 [Ogataea angusta]|uniref:Uncharacterized protein n=1 Tax=Pichia angusta TaxID=870730 RepID=A0AAN6DBC6_PICAN|nr:uncharacterized protein KL928_004810 [Ogataea angusta]KAG7816254.1 hypothetical protein KL928_004810 [Ogataea angusta]
MRSSDGSLTKLWHDQQMRSPDCGLMPNASADTGTRWTRRGSSHTARSASAAGPAARAGPWCRPAQGTICPRAQALLKDRFSWRCCMFSARPRRRPTPAPATDACTAGTTRTCSGPRSRGCRDTIPWRQENLICSTLRPQGAGARCG